MGILLGSFIINGTIINEIKVMHKFLKDIMNYMPYAKYSAKAELKTEVANSYLNWLWWIIEPVAFMLIYTFISKIAFRTGGEFFPVFVLIGFVTWGFFSLMVLGSIKIIKNNSHIVSKIYIPKYILLLKQSFVYCFKTGIAYVLVMVLILFFKVPLTFYMLWVIPLFIILYIICFGFSLFLMHFGVYVEDLHNLTVIVLKLMFYMSGIFYQLRNIDMEAIYVDILINVNPAAFMIEQFRIVLLEARNPNMPILLLWLLIGLLVSSIGIRLIQRHENTYAKVI